MLGDKSYQEKATALSNLCQTEGRKIACDKVVQIAKGLEAKTDKSSDDEVKTMEVSIN